MDRDVGQRIQDLRESRNYTREGLAEKIEISSKFLYEIEKRNKGFSAETLLKISKELQVSCDYILTGTDIYIIEKGKHNLEKPYESGECKKYYMREILGLLEKMCQL